MNIIVHAAHVQVDSISVNDAHLRNSMGSYYSYQAPLNEEKAADMHKILLEHAEEVAKMIGLHTVIVDVHPSLLLYDLYIQKLGYKLNNERCNDGSHWIQSIKYVY